LNVIALASVRPDLGVQSELEWYYQRAESEIGIRSAFGAMQAQLMIGRSGGCSPIEPLAEDRRREAVVRMRRIGDTLRRTDRASQRVIAAAYEPRAWGPEVRRLFPKPIDGVAYMLFGDLSTVIQKQKRDVVRSHVTRCERLFSEACAAYAEQRRAQRVAA
jgi:hypothetical protein